MKPPKTAVCMAIPRPDTGRPPLRIEAAGATDIGRKRTRNEDAFTVAPEVGVFAVADGLASRPFGQLASALAVESVTEILRADIPRPASQAPEPAADLCARFTIAVQLANERILGMTEGAACGMAATFAGVLVGGDAVCIAHLGDARVYRLRDGALAALTEDHNVANELIARGTPPWEALARPDGAALTRALGLEARPDVGVRLESARPGDVLLVCSDGLYRMVPNPEMERILLDFDPVDIAVDRLIQCANGRGGRDNVTAVVVRWEGEP
jgi:protein phosphatase